jgi:hypothetical protein
MKKKKRVLMRGKRFLRIWGKMENSKGAPIFLFKMLGKRGKKEGEEKVDLIGEVPGETIAQSCLACAGRCPE